MRKALKRHGYPALGMAAMVACSGMCFWVGGVVAREQMWTRDTSLEEIDNYILELKELRRKKLTVELLAVEIQIQDLELQIADAVSQLRALEEQQEQNPPLTVDEILSLSQR